MKDLIGNSYVGEQLRMPDFLAGLAARDITISLDHDRLRCGAPAGAMTAELRDQLRDRKNEIIAFLTMATAATRQQSAIIPLQPRGTRTPIYAVPGHIGAPFSFSALSKHLGDDQPFYALQPSGFDGQSEPMDRVEDIAEYFADQIIEYQPKGRYVIAGYCSGAATAFELAKVLSRRGADVPLIALFGPLHPATHRETPRRLYFSVVGSANTLLRELTKLPTLLARLQYLSGRLRERVHYLVAGKSGGSIEADPVSASRERLKSAAIAALRRYVPTSHSGRVCIFLPNKAWRRSGAAPHRWLEVAPHAELYFGPQDCDGARMLDDPDAPAFAALYRQATHNAMNRDTSIRSVPCIGNVV